MSRKSPYVLHLSAAEKNQLESMARKYTSPYYEVVRARMILSAAQGLSNDQIAAHLSVPRQIVSKWRKRFFEEGLAGLENEPRSGRPPVFPPGSGRASQGSGL
jgi:transposase